MCASNVFGVISNVLGNWISFCLPGFSAEARCDYETWKRIYMTSYVTYALYYITRHIAQWAFAFRYLEVAEMLGREDKSDAKHREVRKKTSKICYAGAVLIVINYAVYSGYGLWSISNDRPFEERVNSVTWMVTVQWIPLTFYLIYDITLFVALAWICRSLRKNPDVMANEKYMGLHSALLLLSTALNICTLPKALFETPNHIVLVFSIAGVVDFFITILMTFIMNQVNSPQQSTWSIKFSPKNSKALTEHIDDWENESKAPIV